MSETFTDSTGDTWEIYRDNAGEWRWRRTAQNGNIVGASTQGYNNKADCIANARRHGMDGEEQEEDPPKVKDMEVVDDPEEVDGPEENSTPPNRYNVSSYGWDSDVEGLVKRLDREDICLPKFQRGFVWDRADRSRFIESLILGLPVPNVFLAQDSKSNKLNIVDGQQRLKSLQAYLNGKFSLSGKYVQEELKGRYFSRDVAKAKSSKVLEDRDVRALSDAVLHAIVIKPDPVHDDPARGHEYNQAVIQIFQRLNTSGTPLKAQEIRASIFYGSFYDLLLYLNKDAAWRELFGSSHSHSRLKDVELILRFIALREKSDSYQPPMPKFLDDFMGEHRDIDPGKASEIETAFKKVVNQVRNTIGKEGLRKGGRLSAPRFDAVMAGFDAYLQKHPDPSAQELGDRLKALEDDPDYKASSEQWVNEAGRVRKRLERAREIFGAA